MADKKQLDEFGLIAELLAPLADNQAAARLSDDAARVQIPEGHELIISTDMLLAGVHFPFNADGALIARRVLACNISDLAAKGARPYGCLLNLGVSEDWDNEFLRLFVETFAAGLKTYDMQLWGGDTVLAAQGFAGLTVHGLARTGAMLTRADAQDGDDVFVTGTIGDGFLDLPGLGPAYAAPQPPIAFGQKLCGLASAAIDVSDGLMADLDHICRASKGGMSISADAVPLSAAGRAFGDLAALVAGGDDLQIAFTAPPANRSEITDLAQKHDVRLSHIGIFNKNADSHAVLRSAEGEDITPKRRGYRHF